MGFNDVYRRAAENVADFFIKNNLGMVYGGANVGLMKILSDKLLENGNEVIGVMPQLLVDKEVAHNGLKNMIIVDSMSTRKQKMVELSDGFIALPGGFGTLDELAEILVFNQLRICDKPLGILNVAGYFDKLLDFFKHAANEGFVRQEHNNNLIVSDNIDDLVKQMQQYRPLSTDKWIKDILKESEN
jgi:uncharacterized protein (TIGR00730 family)